MAVVMLRLSLLPAALALLFLQSSQPEPPAPAPNLRDLTPAILPIPRLDEPWWAERHSAIVEQVHLHPDVRLLLLGDSITQNYEKANPPDENFAPTWKQFYEPRQTLNLGFSGDTTANLLWRLTHGEIDRLRPQAAVVLIGTNNTGHGHQSAEQTEAGIGNVVGTLTQRLPQTRVLLLGILPSDVSPEKTATDKAINAWLEKRYGKGTDKKADAHTDARVTYLDIGSIFMNASGALDTGIFYDPRLPHPGKALHPDTIGQRKMAEAIEPTLAKLMYDKPRITAEPASAQKKESQP
jgi:lysophospholipase L1-like esterase